MKMKVSVLRHCSKMLRLLIDSQLGYELRHLRDPIRERIVQAAVLGGSVVSVDENQNYSVTNKKAPTSFAGADVLDRARVVAVGVETFVELASRGVFPGFGGYELASQDLMNRVPEQQQQQHSTVVPLTISK
uniref:Fructose-bisphosphate aldolase n=1 Tax=Globodera pallida TaxID=36090 RepID=A0A183BZ05_GLOPA